MRSAGPKPSNEREPLAGLVERVTFHNADSGFSVLRIKVRGRRDLVTVLGAHPTGGGGYCEEVRIGFPREAVREGVTGTAPRYQSASSPSQRTWSVGLSQR